MDRTPQGFGGLQVPKGLTPLNQAEPGGPLPPEAVLRTKRVAVLDFLLLVAGADLYDDLDFLFMGVLSDGGSLKGTLLRHLLH